MRTYEKPRTCAQCDTTRPLIEFPVADREGGVRIRGNLCLDCAPPEEDPLVYYARNGWEKTRQPRRPNKAEKRQQAALRRALQMTGSWK